MNRFITALNQQLDRIREQDLYRELRCVLSSQGPRMTTPNRTLLNFSSNDYLGLAQHPKLKAAACRAVAEFGAGAGASRLICGSLAPHHQLEEALAAFKDTEAALSFASGYAAAQGAIGAVLGPGDIVILDKLVHACIVDAARLCGAKIRVCKHNDLNDLERILQWADGQGRVPPNASRSPRILIVTESVFSMDGDRAPLTELVALKEKHGAWLMLDEAHATGLFGPHRRGLAEAAGVAGQVEIQMGTLGKALGAAGGYICGARSLIDLLINRARSFIFTTAPPPATVAAATAGVELVRSAEGRDRTAQLWANLEQLQPTFRAGPWRGLDLQSPIIPLIIGGENEALQWSAALRQRNLLVPAIRYPTVARHTARLRLTVSAAHSRADLTELAQALQHCWETLSASAHA